MSCAKAIEAYTGRNGQMRLNCSQSIIYAFGEMFSVPEGAMSSFASCGRGGAPEGKCGSLHAAEYLLAKGHPEKVIECREIFRAAAGSTQCKEIRALKKLSCLGCVQTAAKFVEWSTQ
jgi:hypothetical protein